MSLVDEGMRILLNMGSDAFDAWWTKLTPDQRAAVTADLDQFATALRELASAARVPDE